jgi:hypothetical protein
VREGLKMKYIGWGLGGLLVLALILVGFERLAAERIEVVELHALDEAGEVVVTRLWVADHDGKQYLRVGSDGSGWFSRLEANPEIQITRNGETKNYTAIPDPTKSEAVNAAMQAKYTWGDTVIGKLVGSREGSIPIELRPRD